MYQHGCYTLQEKKKKFKTRKLNQAYDLLLLCNLEIWFITRYAPLSLITTFLGNGIDPFNTDLDYVHLVDDASEKVSGKYWRVP